MGVRPALSGGADSGQAPRLQCLNAEAAASAAAWVDCGPDPACCRVTVDISRLPRSCFWPRRLPWGSSSPTDPGFGPKEGRNLAPPPKTPETAAEWLAFSKEIDS